MTGMEATTWAMLGTSGLLFGTDLWAGVQNALAGGGSFVTLPVLILSGMDPRAANVTSTVALFPGQLSSGLAAWSLAAGAERLSFRALLLISLAGVLVGGVLLLVMPAASFARLLPWLLFATVVFAWGSFGRRFQSEGGAGLKPGTAAVTQALIAVYGGYFGGGIGFLMLAAFTMAGLPMRRAGATKNVLVSVTNTSAVALFVFSPAVHWVPALMLGGGAVLGGLAGARILRRMNDLPLRVFIVVLGTALTIGLFLSPL